MDLGSKEVVKALDAFTDLRAQLSSLGYKLYLETKAQCWTQPHSLAFCRKGYFPDTDPALMLGFGVAGDRTGNRSIIFSILVGWNTSRWSVQASVEDEDGSRESITDLLWESPDYEATTIDGLVDALQTALRALTSSVGDQRVATYLSSIGREP